MFLPNAGFEVNFLKSLVNYLGQAGEKLQKNASRVKKKTKLLSFILIIFLN